MMKLLIKNGRVVHPVTGTVVLQDILAENGRIVLMERGLDGEADRVVDAAGLMVAPGLVDMHVHLRDPGLTYKEDILTGCAAAARGGVTSMACMANTSPAVDCPEQVKYVLDRAKAANGVGVYPIAALSLGLRGEEPTDAEALKAAGRWPCPTTATTWTTPTSCGMCSSGPGSWSCLCCATVRTPPWWPAGR